jgi:AraC-like DNA-binding protein
MKYSTIAPPEELAPYVRCFWVYEGEASVGQPYIYRGYADGCTEMIFHYRGVYDILVGDAREKSFAAGVHGQTRTYSRAVINESFSIFGCYLFPHAVTAVFGLPATDFADRMTDFASALGGEGRELEERMLSTADTAEHVRILSAFLKRRIDRSRPVEPRILVSIAQMFDTRGTASVTELSKRHFFSHRQFERKFKEFSGFSPKLFARITRFQSALKEFGSGKSLINIALDCGYYDQSHFISDFKEFSGYSPKVYFSGAAEGSEYLQT